MMTPQDFKAWRTRLGWTQVKAADMLGLTNRAVGHYEQGTRTITPRIAKLCAFLKQRRPNTKTVWVVHGDDHDHDMMSQWHVGVFDTEAEANAAIARDRKHYRGHMNRRGRGGPNYDKSAMVVGRYYGCARGGVPVELPEGLPLVDVS